MVRKALGMDQVVVSIVSRLGNLELALLVDDYAEGRDTGLIDLILVGDIDRRNLDDLVAKTERYIGRKIRTFVLTSSEYSHLQPVLAKRSQLVLWRGGPEPAGETHEQIS
jgi:hypothetical protein